MIRGVRVLVPSTLEEALSSLSDLGPKGMAIAGGTDVIVNLRRAPQADITLVDISHLGELKGISLEGDHIRIGALETHEAISRADVVREHATALAEACAEVGSLQIRNRGTIGGNVGNASPCADGLTALVGLQAEVEIVGPQGEVRRIPVEEVVERPYRTKLRPGELMVAFYVPLFPGARSAFIKLGRRNALAIARINAAAAVRVEDGKVAWCSIAAGSVMPRTERLREAEAVVLGEEASVETAYKAGEAAALRMIEVSGVRWSTPYKEPAVKAIVARVLARAMGIWSEGWRGRCPGVTV